MYFGFDDDKDFLHAFFKNAYTNNTTDIELIDKHINFSVFCPQLTISAFMDQRFERISSTQRALWMLKKFEGLNLPNLGVQEKYQRILNHYARDIEMVSKLYQKNKADPPIARDLPPVAGSYTYCIHGYKCIII